jgi:hypothetical protein
MVLVSTWQCEHSILAPPVRTPAWQDVRVFDRALLNQAAVTLVCVNALYVVPVEVVECRTFGAVVNRAGVGKEHLFFFTGHWRPPLKVFDTLAAIKPG